MFNSYTFNVFHTDVIVNSTTPVTCPAIDCEMVCFKNNSDSNGNVVIGSDRITQVGTGIVLEPGMFTGWIPAQNLNLFWHKEADQATQLEYMMIGHATPTVDHNAILLEGTFHYLLQENGYLLLREG